MRMPVSLLAGAALTLALFALLALLVVPPEAEPELREELTLALAEAPAEPAPEPVPAASAAPPPPPSAPTPPPRPAPAPQAQSAIALPEPELPPLDAPDVPLDETLPELTETPPEPTPQPDPEPRPAPEPQPEPAPTPAPAPSPAPAAETAAAPSASSQARSNEPVDVGASAQATRRVPPEYPSRARRRGLEGHVVVQFIIRRDGSVERDSIEVVEADPRRVFDRVARRAIAGWQFAAAEDRRRARQRLEFHLK